MSKKIIACMLIAVILINGTIQNLVYAVTDSQGVLESVLPTGEETSKYINEHGQDAVENIYENGKANVNPSSGARQEELKVSKNTSSKLAQIISDTLNIVPTFANFFMTHIIGIFQENKKIEYKEYLYEKGEKTDNFIIETKEAKIEYFTIEDVVFNRYYLFNIDFFEFTSKSNDATLVNIKRSVASWYIAMRNIAIAAQLVILIYIGIRMAISTIAEEQAKYKKMLMSWGVSLLILFFMHYIIAGLYALQDWIISILGGFVSGEGFEEAIIKDTHEAIKIAKGWDSVSVVITIYIIVYYEIKFFIMYFKRLLTVGFLITISPLITISYAIDAAGDGKAQIFNVWLKEMIFNIFIQVIHAIIYAIFILSAAEIAKQIPIMGAILFTTLSRAVKVVRTSLKIDSNFTKSESLLNKLKKK